jgi:hypothetical protein
MIENNLLRLNNAYKKYGKNIKIQHRHKEALNRWYEKYEAWKLKDETKNYINFQEIILKELLGYKNDIDFEFGYSLDNRNVEFMIMKNDEPYIPIELKGTDINLDKSYKGGLSPVEQSSNYANKRESIKWFIVSNYYEFRLYYHESQDKYIKFNLDDLKHNDDILKDFLLVFSKIAILDENILNKLYDSEGLFASDYDLENEFYKLYSQTRLMLIKELEYSNNLNKNEAINYAQLILNRYIFICFCEDKDLLPDNVSSEEIITPIRKKNLRRSEIWQRINGLFIDLYDGNPEKGITDYNGGLFTEDLIHLKIRDKIEEKDFYKEITIKYKFPHQDHEINNELKHYPSINKIYHNLLVISSFNFDSDIDVNILGHIFENSISDIEEIKEEKTSKRKKDGVYYTPDEITTYICENTIIPYLSKTKDNNNVNNLIKEYKDNIVELEDKLTNIKIVDPACGSGAFLNKTIDILVDIHKTIHNIKYKDKNNDLNPYFDNIEHRKNILLNNIYGVDKNKESIEITKLSLFLKIAKKENKLPNLDKNIKCGNSLINDSQYTENPFNWENEFKEVFNNGGFDIVIGNPPYGAEFSKEVQTYLNNKYIKNGSESAISFIKLSYDKILKNEGYFGFIIPKSFTFATNYESIRKFLLNYITQIIDCKKVWKDVKLEQVMLFFRKNAGVNKYISGVLEESEVHIKGKIAKENYNIFNMFLNDITDKELYIALKIRKNNHFIKDIAMNNRGGIFQKYIVDEGDISVLGGAEIQREGIIGIKGKINSEKIKENEKNFINENSILVQRIVAHITNPTDHIKITACYPTNKKYAIVDTINQITFNKKYDCRIFWALFNSKLINWYSYRFIFAKAIRTMQFDNPVTNRIPIFPENKSTDLLLTKSKQSIEIHLKILEERKSFHKYLKRDYNISKINKKLTEYYNLSYDDFYKEIKKQYKEITRKESDKLETEFKESLNIIKPLTKEINSIDKEIDHLVYELYDLTEKEIAIIEN